MKAILVMGVSGSGKTTIGSALAAALGWVFIEGDDFHPPANVAKMASGIPLTDDDRAPWLKRLRSQIEICLQEDRRLILASSALKRRYREQLLADDSQVGVVYLRGSHNLIFERMQIRRNHYMKSGMLQSQFDDLEEPGDEALHIDITETVDRIVAKIIQEFNLTNQLAAPSHN